MLLTPPLNGAILLLPHLWCNGTKVPCWAQPARSSIWMSKISSQTCSRSRKPDGKRLVGRNS